MYIAVRSYLTTGVALAGAGAIALAPITPALHDVPVPSIRSSSVATNLTAFANPIQAWVDVATATFTSLGDLGQLVLADPAPILQQVVINQASYAATTVGALQELGQGIASQFDPTNPFGTPALLQQAASQFAAGQINDGTQSLWQAFLFTAFVAVNPLQSVLSIPGQMAQNVANVVKGLPTDVLLAGLSVLSPLYTAITVMGTTGQTFVDAVKAGDTTTALSTLINAPATITGAVLNGTPDGNVGILGSTGAIAQLLSIRDTIAAQLAPSATSTAATKTATTLPSAAAKAVTLALTPTSQASAPATATSPTGTSTTEGTTAPATSPTGTSTTAGTTPAPATAANPSTEATTTTAAASTSSAASSTATTTGSETKTKSTSAAAAPSGTSNATGSSTKPAKSANAAAPKLRKPAVKATSGGGPSATKHNGG